MKGVLIGADFLQLENEVKLLEINTDVDILAMDIPFLNLNPLFNYLTANSFTKLVCWVMRYKGKTLGLYPNCSCLKKSFKWEINILISSN